MSRLPGTFIQNAFLKLRFEYYWECVFEMATCRPPPNLKNDELPSSPTRCSMK